MHKLAIILLFGILKSILLESARIVDTGGPKSMRVRAGTTVSLLCRAEGHPKPKVLWTKLYMGR